MKICVTICAHLAKGDFTKIKISKQAASGSVPIPPNEYWVSLNPESAEITLTASGKDIRIKATRRKMSSKSRTTTISFHSGGGKTWSIVVATPKQGEWVAFVEYE